MNCVPSVPAEIGNTRTISAAKKWCFTLNNWKEEEYNYIINTLKNMCSIIVIGKEVGDSGTPHLQGFFKLLVKNRPMTVLKNIKRCHWEKCKGSDDDNIRYCKKDGNFYYFNINEKEKFIQVIDNLYDWEVDLLKIFNGDKDDRTIHWVYGPSGGNGKTTFQKYCFTHLDDCIVLGGKDADMKNGVVQYVEKNKKFPKIVLINIPFSVEHISYGGIEAIKDMFFFSGKYEGGMVCGPCPHVCIFSNCEPRQDKFSDNRDINIIIV